MEWMTEEIFNGSKVKSLNIREGEYDVSGICSEWYGGAKKFNLFFADFGKLFVDQVEDTVVPEFRIRDNDDNLSSLSFVSDRANQLLNELIEVVNFSSRPVISDDRKRKYKYVLKELADEMSKFRKGEKLSKEDLTIVPMKGGSYFWNFLKEKENNTLEIECKRIPVKGKKSFNFGMRIESDTDFKDSKKLLEKFSGVRVNKLRIVELCVVSGMTTLGFLMFLERNNIKPKTIEINTVAISQQGYEFILEYLKNKNIGVKFVTGGVFYRLGDYYQSKHDELLTLDGKLVIGDVRSFLD
jgi:hypothetical protein